MRPDLPTALTGRASPVEVSGKSRRLPVLPVFGALLLLGLLWCSGFPDGAYDDLFFLGTSLNLAQGGDLSNPLLARQQFPGHFFFLHPPLHSYAVAGWLKIFGISAAAVTAFPLLMYFITAVATIAILHKHGAPVWLEWLVPLGVNIAFLPSGLRPEPFAIALIMAGFALIECGCGRARVAFPGFLLLFLGASASPRIAPLAAALTGLVGWRLWRASPAVGLRRGAFLAAACVALLVTGLAFLLMIHFRLGEFLTVFNMHATVRVGSGKLPRIASFARGQRASIWPLWGVFFALLFFSVRRWPKDALGQLGILAACMLPTEAVIANLVSHIIWFMILAVIALAASLCRGASRRRTALIATGLFLAFSLANCKTLLNVIGLQTRQIKTDLGPLRAQALALRSTPGHSLVIDTSVARYLYDYRIPAGAVDIGFAVPFPGAFVTMTNLQAGDIYLVNISARKCLSWNTYLPPPPDPIWNPVGLNLLTFDRYPRLVYIVRAEECNGLRPEMRTFP